MVAKLLDGACATRSLLTRLGWALDHVQVWVERRRARLDLARLDERLLRDVGLSNADVQAEMSKPFWQA